VLFDLVSRQESMDIVTRVVPPVGRIIYDNLTFERDRDRYFTTQAQKIGMES
jgi:hypothetical protein